MEKKRDIKENNITYWDIATKQIHNKPIKYWYYIDMRTSDVSINVTKGNNCIDKLYSKTKFDYFTVVRILVNRCTLY